MFDAGGPLMKPALPLLLAAMLSWLSGCSTAPSRPAPPAAIVPQTLAPSSGVGPYQIFALAAAQGSLGIPYQFGGADPYRGFDCSGLVQYSYLQAGLLLPAQDEALTVKATRNALAKLDADPSRLMN